MSGTIILEPQLGLDQAQSLQKRLGAPAALAWDIEIDASRVEEASAAWVMVLVGFQQARPEAAGPLRVIDPSSEFVEAFSDLGLFEELMRMEFN